MPYKRFKKVLFKKTKGKWKKMKAYPTQNRARVAMRRLTEKEDKKKRDR